MKSLKNKYKVLLVGATIAATLSSGAVWANSVDQTVLAKDNNIKVSEVREEIEKKSVSAKPKMNAEDLYKQAEDAELSELAKMTSTRDWMLTELIENGEFGTTEEEIKANLTKEGINFKDIDIAKLLKEQLVKESESAPANLGGTDLTAETDVNYDNLITKHYNLGSLEEHENDAYTKGGQARKAAPKVEEKVVEEVKVEEVKEVKEVVEVEKAVEPVVSSKSNVIPAYPHKSFKSYMSWTALHPQSKQGIFAAKATPDAKTGVMMYNGRYLIALGSAYASYVGEEIDVVMESGQIIPAVIGDFKADEHTDQYNSTHLLDGSVIEFVVSSNEAAAQATNRSGSYNNVFPGLVKEFRK